MDIDTFAIALMAIMGFVFGSAIYSIFRVRRERKEELESQHFMGIQTFDSERSAALAARKKYRRRYSDADESTVQSLQSLDDPTMLALGISLAVSNSEGDPAPVQTQEPWESGGGSSAGGGASASWDDTPSNSSSDDSGSSDSGSSDSGSSGGDF